MIDIALRLLVTLVFYLKDLIKHCLVFKQVITFKLSTSSHYVIGLTVPALGFQIHGFLKSFSSKERVKSDLKVEEKCKFIPFTHFLEKFMLLTYCFIAFVLQSFQNLWVLEPLSKISWVPWNPCQRSHWLIQPS